MNDPIPWTPSERQRHELVEQGVAVVANLSTDKALIQWAKQRGLFVRVDRRSEWGNPFKLHSEAERDTVCDRYAAYLSDRPALLERVAELRGRVLGCWCCPKRCHGDHLAALANGVAVVRLRQRELFT